ncbi:VanZ family protein [Paenibacillus sp. MMS18-CY102]|uniref:VanZ family protein n=1 Tax=Paenibacillus sp. MMS18-CY102 TaxID=2682849 RepID=UPI001365D0F4|nr:VanZ family protein [Paenibacillus sp. MMS18-CY102]MWC27615.1 VanZ family protein [Paenibacillus sp. MMS18-CY102]
MTRRERVTAGFLYGIFICYIIFLIKLLFLSRVSLVDLFDSQRAAIRSINLIPFKSIKDYMVDDPATIRRFAFSNVVGNIVIFIPLGIFLLVFKNGKRIMANVLLLFLVSLFVEIMQWLLGIGVADIDDIILNSLGGWIGIVGCKLLFVILRDKRRVRTVITMLSAIGLPAILYILFMVKLRL